jgi:FkbM family methyltransferase
VRDPYAIIHKKVTKIALKTKPWNFPGFTRLMRISDKPHARRVFFGMASLIQRNMEKYEIEIFKNFLKHNMTVLDVGANIGVYTKIASEIIGRKGRVFSFEPEPKNFEALKRAVSNNILNNVVVSPKALSNEVGHVRLYKDEVNIGNHSLSKDNLLKGADYVEVQSTTVDKYFVGKGGVDLIKMDIQGSEAKVIEGAKSILNKYKPDIMMEFWPQGLRHCGSDPVGLLKQLQSYGYSLRLIDKTHKKLHNFSPDQIMDTCEKQRHGADYANLLLV